MGVKSEEFLVFQLYVLEDAGLAVLVVLLSGKVKGILSAAVVDDFYACGREEILIRVVCFSDAELQVDHYVVGKILAPVTLDHPLGSVVEVEQLAGIVLLSSRQHEVRGVFCGLHDPLKLCSCGLLVLVSISCRNCEGP